MSKLKEVRTLTTTAMLIAIGIVLGFFKIPITNVIEIRFTQLPLSTVGILFGPGAASIAGILMDIGQYLIKPTGPYFPGFTISSAVTGVIFGSMFYKKEITVKRIFVTQILYTIVVGILLNGLWLSMLYSSTFYAILAARLLKEIIMIPINTILLSLIVKPVTHTYIVHKQGWAVK